MEAAPFLLEMQLPGKGGGFTPLGKKEPVTNVADKIERIEKEMSYRYNTKIP